MSLSPILIAIEGIDCSGKTTLIYHILTRITSYTVKSISFPNRNSFTGDLIDRYLSNKVSLNPQTIHLLFSANRWETMDKISGCEIVLCDRYYFSGISYTAVKGVDKEWCRGPDRGLKEPDLVIFIDIEADQVAKRPGFGKEKYEKMEYQREVYRILKETVMEHENGKIVCGEGSVEEVGERVYALIIDLMNKRK